MKILLVLLLLLPVVSYADTYSWEDDDGIHFVDDVSKIPKKYRNRATKRDEPAEPTKATRDEKKLVNGLFKREGFEGVLASQVKFFEDEFGEYYYRKAGIRKLSSGGPFMVPVTQYNRKASHYQANEVKIYCRGRLRDVSDIGLADEAMQILKDGLCNSNQP